MRTWLITGIAILCSTTLGFAQNLNGQWKGSVDAGGAPMEIVFTIKVDGQKLTGTNTSSMGDLPLLNGKVNGAEFSFDVDLGGQVLPHKGTVSGDTITLSVEGIGNAMKFTRVGSAAAPATAAPAATAAVPGATGIDGKWKGSMAEMNMELVFTFKVNGNVLTGNVSTGMGEMPITNGKVNGASFTFDVDAGGQVISHTAKFADNAITVDVPAMSSTMKLARVAQ